jgi:GNAT superfamily N-acetyltransferase
VIERSFRAEDAPALAALVRACDETYREWLPAGWTPPEVGEDWAARFLEPNRWSLLLEDGGAVVGFASFRQAYEGVPPAASGPVLDGVAHVGAVFVAPSHWRRGVASRMLGQAEDTMRSRGFVKAILWTPEGAPAERLYSTLGWERDGRRMWHDWVGVWVVGYAKTL